VETEAGALVLVSHVVGHIIGCCAVSVACHYDGSACKLGKGDRTDYSCEIGARKM
jgi:hypothetical protein